MGDGAPTDSSTLTHILCGNPLSRAICREISDACRHGGCQGGESVARRATGAAPACGGEGVGETRPAPGCGGGGVSETGAAPGCGGGGVSETGAAPASRESPDIGVSLEAGVVWVSCCAREGVAGVVWVSRSARRGGVVRRSAGEPRVSCRGHSYSVGSQADRGKVLVASAWMVAMGERPGKRGAT